jgi:hypothetical protein
MTEAVPFGSGFCAGTNLVDEKEIEVDDRTEDTRRESDNEIGAAESPQTKNRLRKNDRAETQRTPFSPSLRPRVFAFCGYVFSCYKKVVTVCVDSGKSLYGGKDWKHVLTIPPPTRFFE